MNKNISKVLSTILLVGVVSVFSGCKDNSGDGVDTNTDTNIGDEGYSSTSFRSHVDLPGETTVLVGLRNLIYCNVSDSNGNIAISKDSTVNQYTFNTENVSYPIKASNCIWDINRNGNVDIEDKRDNYHYSSDRNIITPLTDSMFDGDTKKVSALNISEISNYYTGDTTEEDIYNTIDEVTDKEIILNGISLYKKGHWDYNSNGSYTDSLSAEEYMFPGTSGTKDELINIYYNAAVEDIIQFTADNSVAPASAWLFDISEGDNYIINNFKQLPSIYFENESVDTFNSNVLTQEGYTNVESDWINTFDNSFTKSETIQAIEDVINGLNGADYEIVWTYVMDGQSISRDNEKLKIMIISK